MRDKAIAKNNYRQKVVCDRFLSPSKENIWILSCRNLSGVYFLFYEITNLFQSQFCSHFFKYSVVFNNYVSISKINLGKLKRFLGVPCNQHAVRYYELV